MADYSSTRRRKRKSRSKYPLPVLRAPAPPDLLSQYISRRFGQASSTSPAQPAECTSPHIPSRDTPTIPKHVDADPNREAGGSVCFGDFCPKRSPRANSTECTESLRELRWDLARTLISHGSVTSCYSDLGNLDECEHQMTRYAVPKDIRIDVEHVSIQKRASFARAYVSEPRIS